MCWGPCRTEVVALGSLDVLGPLAVVGKVEAGIELAGRRSFGFRGTSIARPFERRMLGRSAAQLSMSQTSCSVMAWQLVATVAPVVSAWRLDVLYALNRGWHPMEHCLQVGCTADGAVVPKKSGHRQASDQAPLLVGVEQPASQEASPAPSPCHRAVAAWDASHRAQSLLPPQ